MFSPVLLVLIGHNVDIEAVGEELYKSIEAHGLVISLTLY